MTLTHDDEHTLDRYEVETTATGVFICAMRFIGDLGRDPIFYDSLADVPQPSQNEIQQKIWEKVQGGRK